MRLNQKLVTQVQTNYSLNIIAQMSRTVQDAHETYRTKLTSCKVQSNPQGQNP